MDQAVSHEGKPRAAMAPAGRRSGWSEAESRLLWETADDAQQQGMPLKAVFEQIARQTGRRPNSIRNYYYAQVRQQEGGQERAARFVPFTQQEVDWLMEQVLVARAAGQSVRACLQKLSGGDHSLMLRYQNKYRAVIKSRPDYVRQVVEKLNARGVECEPPQVNHRTRADLQESGDALVTEARRAGDPELARACDVLTRCLRERRAASETRIAGAARALVAPIKDYIALAPQARAETAEDFCDAMREKLGALEAALEE